MNQFDVQKKIRNGHDPGNPFREISIRELLDKRLDLNTSQFRPDSISLNWIMQNVI